MTAHPGTKAHAVAWVYPMAKGSSSRVVHHKQKMFDHSRAGQARGLCCGQTSSAYEPQDRRLGRGARPPVLSNSHWPVNSSPLADRRVSFPSWGIRQHLRVRAELAAPRVFHSARVLGSRPSRANTVSDELLQNIALSEVHHRSLSLSPRLRPHQHGRRLEVWRHQISVMRCLA